MWTFDYYSYQQRLWKQNNALFMVCHYSLCFFFKTNYTLSKVIGFLGQMDIKLFKF